MKPHPLHTKALSSSPEHWAAYNRDHLQRAVKTGLSISGWGNPMEKPPRPLYRCVRRVASSRWASAESVWAPDPVWLPAWGQHQSVSPLQGAGLAPWVSRSHELRQHPLPVCHNPIQISQIAFRSYQVITTNSGGLLTKLDGWLRMQETGGASREEAGRFTSRGRRRVGMRFVCNPRKL